MDDGESKQRIHWRAPVTMIVSLVAGILFAVGHHVFYRNLDGQPVSEAKYDQQMNIRIGTALAYLTRAAFVVAISVAYWQMFWRAVLHKAMPLSTIDSLADLLNSLLSFFSLSALRANPVLFVLAAVSWLIPLAAVVPPATLTVSAIQVTSYKMQNLPALNFKTGPMPNISYKPAGAGPNWGNQSAPPQPGYVGSSQPLLRLTTATALQGTLPNFPSPAENSSYDLKFDAPAVQCTPAPLDILEGFDEAMGSEYFKHVQNHTANSGTNIVYISWTPSISSIVPFANRSFTTGRLPITSVSNPYLGSYQKGPATVYIAFDSRGFGDWAALNCSLWNTTYTTNFEFSANGQRVTVKNTEHRHPVAIQPLSEIPVYTALDFDKYGPGLSYQAIMECLGRVLVGSISRTATWSPLSNDANIFLSNTAYTKELFPIYNNTIVSTKMYNITVQGALKSPQFGRPLADVIENIFQNMTLALFSENAFLGNNSLPANVTTRRMQNVYAYESSRLLLAYGLAFGFTALSVLLGAESLLSNHMSHSNKFSTVIRTTNDASLSSLIENVDRNGADPLPKYLGSLKIQGGSKAGSSEQNYTVLPSVAR